MSIGPQGPLLKNDGPACRVCGCTENNACAVHNYDLSPQSRWAVVACSWVKVEGATPPLCSACSGTEADMAEAITRGCRMLEQSGGLGVGMAVKIGKAALARRKRRRVQNRG